MIRPSRIPRPLLLVVSALALLALAATASAADAPSGQHVFQTAGCTGCHGQNGRGGIGPSFVGDGNLRNDSLVINQILHGGGSMPSFADQLSNAQIAAVASYVRTSWGNDFGKVTLAQVDQTRGGASSSSASGSSSRSSSAGSGSASGGSSSNGSSAGSSSSADASGANASSDGSSSGGASQSADASGGSGGSMGSNGGSGSSDASAGGPSGQASSKVAQPASSVPVQTQLDHAGQDPSSWLMYNKGYRGQRYSSLDQIDRSNVADLQPVCVAQLGSNASFQASPVIYKGTMIVTTPHDTVALDAATCRTRWSVSYSPSGPEPLPTNRGVAVADGRVIRGTTDGHVVAYDATDGSTLWDVDLADSSKGYFLSSAPIVYEGTVLIGTAGADWGAPAVLYALDATDGSTVWSFDEVKQDTFGGADPASTGGGSNWTSYTLDPSSGEVYVSVGNPSPDFAPEYRPGKNLYTNSVIVLDASKGTLDHYYQQIPNDSHDWDTAAAPVLFTLSDSGSDHHYMAVANKGGYLYVYDEDQQELAYKVPTTTIQNTDQVPTQDGARVCPGITGGVEWNGPAFDPKDGTLFVNSVDWCTTYRLGEVRYSAGQIFFGGTYTPDPVDKAVGWLHAYDARTGDVRWVYQSDRPLVAAVTPTAGDVVFTGELSGDFLALDATTGSVLYRYYTGGPIGGGVSTYQVAGRQYVAVASGNASRTWTPDAGASATVVVFALPR